MSTDAGKDQILLAAVGSSRDACECLLHWLGLEDVPSPIICGIEGKHASLLWLAPHHRIIVLPYWPRFGTLSCQIAVFIDGRQRVNQCRAEPLDTLRYWLAEAYEDVGARLDVGDETDDVNRLMVAMILECGRKTTFDGDEYYVVGGYVYRVLGEASYEEVGVSE